MASGEHQASEARKNWWLDVGLFAAFLISTAPHFTGMAIHEWLGLALGATVVVHLLFHWQWLVSVTRRFLRRLPGATRLNWALNLLLFLAFITVVLSGVLISESALPLLGIQLAPNTAWRGLHTLSADLALILVAVHVGLHWPWLVATFRRIIWRPAARRFGRRPQPAGTAGALEVQS